MTQLGPSPTAAAPPAPAHIMLALAPVPPASPDTRCSRYLLPWGWQVPGAKRLPTGCRGAGAVPGAVTGSRGGRCTRGSAPGPALGSGPAGDGAGEALRSLFTSLWVLCQCHLEGAVGTPWNCLCTSEACNCSSPWRLSIKSHEKPILLLIWRKEVGRRGRNGQSSRHQWLRGAFPSSGVSSCAGAGGPQHSGGLAGCWGKVGRPQQGPGFQTMAFSAYCLGEVACPCRLQEARASRWGRALLLGGFCRGWALSDPCTVPGAQPRRALQWLGHSQGPWRIIPLVPVLYFSVILGAVLIPLTVPFVSPLESLISSMGQAAAGAAARLSAGAVPGMMVSLPGCGLVWEHFMGSGFPSHFQLSRVSELGADGGASGSGAALGPSASQEVEVLCRELARP